MTGRVRVRELMRRQGLSGEIVRLFHSQRTGIIHGDDGYDVAFSEEAPVVGLGYPELGLGLKVSYGVFFATGSKVPTAINVQPASDARTESTQDAENSVSARVGGFSVV